MFNNVRAIFGQILGNLRKSSESGRKSRKIVNYAVIAARIGQPPISAFISRLEVICLLVVSQVPLRRNSANRTWSGGRGRL